MTAGDWIALAGLGCTAATLAGAALILGVKAVARLTRIADAVDQIPGHIAAAVRDHVLTDHQAARNGHLPLPKRSPGSAWPPRGTG